MVTIGMNYFVLPGKEQVFENACSNVLGALREAEGHDESKIFRNVETGDPEYLIVSRWNDEEAFHQFIRSDAFVKVTSWGKKNILSGRPIHTTYGSS